MLIKSQSEVHLHTGHSVHLQPIHLPDPPSQFFEGLVPRLMLLSNSWNYLCVFLVATLQGMCAYVIRWDISSRQF